MGTIVMAWPPLDFVAQLNLTGGQALRFYSPFPLRYDTLPVIITAPCSLKIEDLVL
jgi:hypothetical protein